MSKPSGLGQFNELPQDEIYLDYAATTPVHPEVAALIYRINLEEFGNPSSLHRRGMQASRLLENARQKIAGRLNCGTSEVFFTSGATESDNIAIFGVMRQYLPQDAHLITCSIEHHAVLDPAKELLREGYSVTFLPVDGRGTVDPEDLRKALRPNTRLVSIMAVNNETGAIQPVEELAKITAESSALFHTDGVQALALLDLDTKTLGADLISLSSHKVYGPKGVGALYVSSGIKPHLSPLAYGGGQEKGLRPGTENLAGIAGFAEAVSLLGNKRFIEKQRLQDLRAAFIRGLSERIPDTVINDGQEQLPSICSVTFPMASAEMMLLRLDKLGIRVSMGSACTSKTMVPSHVLKALGKTDAEAEATLRFSFGMQTVIDEIDRVLSVIQAVWAESRIE